MLLPGVLQVKLEDIEVGTSYTSSIKHSLRPSTQAQSRAEVGTYRVLRKRSSVSAKSSTFSIAEPAAKCSKVESKTGSDIKLQETIGNSVVKHSIHEQALPASFLLAGPSYYRDTDTQPPKKKSRLEKKAKKKVRKSNNLESWSLASKSSPPELNSLRRHTRAKKTGSCASSR